MIIVKDYSKAVVLIICTSLLVLVSGCNLIKSIIDGRSVPKTQNAVSVITYLEKNGVHPDQVALSTFDGFPSNLIEIGQEVAMVFDLSGAKIAGNVVDKGCVPPVALTLENLRTGQKPTTFDSNSNFQLKLIPKLIDLNGNQFQLDMKEEKDYVVFISWSNWEGEKTFNRNVATCLKAIKNNQRAKFHVVLVNLDKQEVWGKDNLARVKMKRTRVEILPH